MKLSEKRIVVIGGSSGIGLAVAKAAVSEGAEVFIGSSQQSKIDKALSGFEEKASGAVVDVTDERSIEEFFKKAGRFDHLVYTAGDWAHREPRKMTETVIGDFEFALGTRFYGALLAVKYAMPTIDRQGSVTLTGGLVAHRPRPGNPLSTAMAGAIEHFTTGLSVDLAPVRVNAVCPGLVATQVWDDNVAEKFEQFIARLPLDRACEPEEIAESYLYLMKCTYVTGQILKVDGGATLV